MGQYSTLLSLIGNTPLIEIPTLSKESGATVLGKCEFLNPSSSVKDRAAKAMIEAAEKDGLLKPGTIIVEPTSGNTGIGLALVCAAKGYKLILTMPESMSLERRALLKAMGAHLELTPAHLGMRGAIEKAEEICENTPSSFMPQQFNNPANPNAHFSSTGPEIWTQTQGQVDILVAGVGTGGSLSGIARYIKPKNPAFKAIAVEPTDSPVISGGNPGPHMIQGIGAGFIPENLDTAMVDEVVQITNDEAINMARRLAKTEGLLVGISAGANALAALKIGMRPENKGKTIVTILCDTGERYLSTILFKDMASE